MLLLSLHHHVNFLEMWGLGFLFGVLFYGAAFALLMQVEKFGDVLEKLSDKEQCRFMFLHSNIITVCIWYVPRWLWYGISRLTAVFSFA